MKKDLIKIRLEQVWNLERRVKILEEYQKKVENVLFAIAVVLVLAFFVFIGYEIGVGK